MKQLLRTIATALTIVGASSASAAIVTLDVDFSGFDNRGTNVALGADFVADNLRVQRNRCDVGHCAALNRNQTINISRTGGGSFTLTSFWYQLLGVRSALTTTASNGEVRSYDASAVGNRDGGHTVDSASFFNDITLLTFYSAASRPGNLRIDTLSFSYDDPSVVPLPAAVWLLLAGLGGLAVAGRRKA